MSGRIRSIKPELLEDAVTAGLSDMAFRLFIACILLADDYGNLRFEPAWLRGQVYWSCDVDSEQFSSAFTELSVLVTPYIVKGQRYGAIKNWSKHQKVSHPGKPRVPGLAEALPKVSGDPLESLAKPSGESPETLLPDLRSPISDLRSPTKDLPRAPARENTPTSGGQTVRPSEVRSADGPQSRQDAPGSVRSDREPPTPMPSQARPVGSLSDAAPADPDNPEPPWWQGVLDTVGDGTGVHLPGREAWLRYAGHRASKARPAERRDAVHWLTTVMVKEARERRDKDRERRDREARFEKQRAGPPNPNETQKLSEAEQKRFAEQLRQRVQQRKGVA